MTENQIPTGPAEPQGSPGTFDQTPPTRPAVVGAPDILGQVADPNAFAATTETVRKSSTGMRAGLAGALLVVAGAGGFAVNSALSTPDGPQSPEAAMEALFEAYGNEDVVGILETLLPSERESLVDPTLALVQEIERLEVIGGGIDLDTFGDLDVVIDGLVVESTPLADGFATVRPTAGTMMVHGTTADFPLGAEIGDALDEEPEVLMEEPVELVDSGFEVVAVEDDGTWYLSLLYSGAEIVREGTTAPLPAFGAGPTPVGGETPEQAVENLVNRGLETDLEGMLAQLDPEEFRVLYDYSPLFLPEAQAMIDELRTELEDGGFAWSLVDLDLTSAEVNGRTVVVLEAIELTGTDGSSTFTSRVEGECVVVDAVSDVNELTHIDTCSAEYADTDGSMLEEFGIAAPDFSALTDAELVQGVTVIERDGRWFISFMPSILYAYVDVAKSLEPSDAQEWVDFGSELYDSFLGPITGTDFIELD